MSPCGTVADWLVAFGTLVLAAVAVFQKTIRGWFYHPDFHVSIKTEPSDCVAVPLTRSDGTFVADSIYLRLGASSFIGMICYKALVIQDSSPRSALSICY